VINHTLKIKDGTPGFLLCLILGAGAIYLSKIIGAPVMLLAIIIGLILHILFSVPPLKPGINWSSRSLLYIGVALMGLRIDVTDLSQAGVLAPLLVLVTLAATLLGGFLIARAFGQSKEFSILMSGAVGVCGVSAAAAMCAALDDCETRNEELAITVAGITVLSTITMIAYPIVSHLFGLDNLGAGILMGGGIHNVSQAVGAGYAVSPEAGDLSVLLKLLRVSMLLPIVIIVSVIWGKNAATPYPNLGAKIRANAPSFLVVFLILAILNCLQLVPAPITHIGNEAAHWALVVSLIAIGIKTDMRQVLTVGLKPLIAMTLITLLMAVMLLAGIYIIGLI